MKNCLFDFRVEAVRVWIIRVWRCVLCSTHVRGPNSEPRVGGKRRCLRCSPGSTLWCGWPDALIHLQYQTPAGSTVSSVKTATHAWPRFTIWVNSVTDASFLYLLVSPFFFHFPLTGVDVPAVGHQWTSVFLLASLKTREPVRNHIRQENRAWLTWDTDSPHESVCFWIPHIYIWASQEGEPGQKTRPLPLGPSVRCPMRATQTAVKGLVWSGASSRCWPTHLSRVQLWILTVFCEEEHVYEVDKNAGSNFRLGRGVDDPFEDHHEHQVAKETQHEDQLGDQHEEYTADLAKVPTNKGEKERHDGNFRLSIKLLHVVSMPELSKSTWRGLASIFEIKWPCLMRSLHTGSWRMTSRLQRSCEWRQWWPTSSSCTSSGKSVCCWPGPKSE